MRRPTRLVWPYLLLSAALLGALGFGWVQTRQKNQLALQNENKYLSAFHKLKWTSENIEERTARLLATNDQSLQESLLADLRVFSAQAVEHMSVLPLMTMNTPRINHFLNTLRSRADEYHDKLNRGIPLTAQEWATLTELRQQSVHFESELSTLLGLVGTNLVRWSDTVRVTSPAQSGVAETPITRTVLQMESALTPPAGEEKATPPGMTPLKAPRTPLGPRVGPEAAMGAVKRFVDMPLQGEPKLTGQSDPDDRLKEFSLYFFDAQKANGTPMNFGVSVHGGQVIFMIDGRAVKERRIGVPELVSRAKQMLKRWGYPEAELVSVAPNDGSVMMDLAPIRDGVAIHTEMIKVSLAMDNGELTGFDARSYWVNRQARNLSPRQLGEKEARERLAPRLKVEGRPRLAVVADRRGTERLTWEFRATLDDQRYMIFVDTETGAEVNVLRVSGDVAPPIGG